MRARMGGCWRSSWAVGALLLCVVWRCGIVDAKDPNGSTESLTFYVHCTDEVAIVAGPGKEQPDLNLVDFGTTLVFDNDVTEGPSPSSKLIGRRQGVAIKDNHANTNYYLLFTIIFENHDKYDGTLQVAGTEIGSGDREISIIGGTGDFRGARGYSTFYLYDSTEYAIIKQDFVLYKNSFNYKPSPESKVADS
ncbi:unnamed protein product [Calypogeia fissa]